MNEEEQKMIWTIGLNDHISGGLDEIMARADKLRKSMEHAFDGLTDPADVVDATLDMIGRRLEELGVSEEGQAKALRALEEDLNSFVQCGTTANDLLAKWGSNFKAANATGDDFIKMMVPLCAAVENLYLPTDKAAKVMDELTQRMTEVGVPTNLWKDELGQLERQIDDFVRKGGDAKEFLDKAKATLETFGGSDGDIERMLGPLKALTEETKNAAKASDDAAKAKAREREELEKMKAASEQDHKNYLLNIAKRSKAHREASMSARSVIATYTRLLSMFGLMPPGAAKFLYTMNSLTAAMEMAGGKANSLSKALGGLLQKALLGFKSLLLMGGGLGAAILAPLVAIGAALAIQLKKLSDAREALKKTLEDSIKVASRFTSELEKQFDAEARAADEASRRIRDAAKAYEELAKSKEAVAEANSAKIVQDIEDERKAWHDANGGASAEDRAAADASFDYEIARQKAQDLARKQQLEVELEKNNDRERYHQRSVHEADKERLLERERQAKDDLAEYEKKRPSRMDIRTENTVGTDYLYENEEEYQKASEEYRRTYKQKREHAEKVAESRRRAEEWLANADKEDAVIANRRTASATNRETARRRSDAELAKRDEALVRAIYAADTATQRKSDEQFLALSGLSAASGKATKARKLAEERLAGSTDEREKAALQFAVKERKIDEDVAKTREKLERDRYALLAQATDTLERDRINAEYEYQRTWADLLAQRRREELADEQALHQRRIDDARKERVERVNSLSAERQDAVARLNAAKQQTATAWGWYRNRSSLAGQIKEWNADAKAREQYEKDYYSLTHGTKSSLYAEAKHLQRWGHEDKMEERISEWRRKKMLSLNDEATLRVALAQDEEKNAQSAVVSIDRTLQRIEDKFEKVLTMEG